jgi:hypothetical protein
MKREIVGMAILLAALGGLWLWQQQQAVPHLPNGAVISESINTPGARTTTQVGGWSEEEARAFYRQALPERGWRYCGTQATPGCTNIFMALAGDDVRIDVYRRADDSTGLGRTIEIWPQAQGDRMQVRIYETSEQAPRN